jgi:hypothetical protein
MMLAGRQQQIDLALPAAARMLPRQSGMNSRTAV